MPKPSMQAMMPDAAVESTGALAGKFEVLGAVYKVHKDKEYEPKPGQTARDNPKVIALVMKVTPLGENDERLEDADTRDIILKLGGKSLATFHPGKGSGPDDADPDDLGEELNTEGNTLYIAGGEVAMNAKSGYTVFMKSLQHRGFDAAKIAQCWSPNFKGLKFELATVTPDKLEGYGQKKGDANADGMAITYKVVQDLVKSKGKGKKAEAEAGPVAVPAKKGKPAPEPEEDDEEDTPPAAVGNDAEAEAIRVLTAAAEMCKGKTKKFGQVITYYITCYGAPKVKGSPKLIKEARKFVENKEWLVEQLMDLGCRVDTADDQVDFPPFKDAE